jgi:hypothetical protein
VVQLFGVPGIFWVFGKAALDFQQVGENCQEEVVLFTHLPT